MTDKNPIQVADRLFAALELLASEGPLGLMELACRLNLNKSTAHRIAASLIYMGYVKQDPDSGKYQLTFKLTSLSGLFLRKLDVVALVHPHLRRLMELSGETVHFVERDGTEAIYIDKVEATQNSMQMVSRVGRRIPLYCSGVGKAIAASLSSEEARRLWEQSPVEPLTPHTITNCEDFLLALEEVRQKGYALDNEENEAGVRCIAAALPDETGAVRYAFSVSAPIQRMDDSRIAGLAEYILAAKEKILAEFR